MNTEIEHQKHPLCRRRSSRCGTYTGRTEQHHLANKVAVVDDGAEALDYLYRRGKLQARRWQSSRGLAGQPHAEGQWAGSVKAIKADDI